MPVANSNDDDVMIELESFSFVGVRYATLM